MPCSASAVSGGRHSAARFGAFTARLCTGLAVLGPVLVALGSARVADKGAELAKATREGAASSHELRSCPTDRRAVSIEADTVRHHLDVLFLQAGGRTVVALGGACVASLDACGEF